MVKFVTLEIKNCVKCPFSSLKYSFDDDGDDWHVYCNKIKDWVAHYLRERDLNTYNRIDERCPLEDEDRK